MNIVEEKLKANLFDNILQLWTNLRREIGTNCGEKKTKI